MGGEAECFDYCGFQNIVQSLKTTHSISLMVGVRLPQEERRELRRANSDRLRIRLLTLSAFEVLPMKNATLFLLSPKYKRPSFTKKFGSRTKFSTV